MRVSDAARLQPAQPRSAWFRFLAVLRIHTCSLVNVTFGRDMV